MSDVKKAAKAKEALLAAARTLTLSVMLKEEDGGGPDLHISPFARLDSGDFIIYTSHLSAAVRALLAGHEVRAMLVADESQSQNIWARVRMRFDIHIEEIARGDDAFAPYCDKLAEVTGPVMGLIRDFTDFHMFRITPQSGVLVTGFASAFSIDGPHFEIQEHLSKS